MIRNRPPICSILLMTLATSAAWAQGRGGPCTLGYELSYGISAIDCLQCTVRSDGNDHWTEYGAEPVVRAVLRVANPIQPGDVLVAIDGKLITTVAGGRALSHPEAGHAARFTVRRGGRQLDLNVMPGTPCPTVSAATAAALASSASRGDTMTQAAKDSLYQRFTEDMGRLHDTIELRYDRDAFGRIYHITFHGDSADLATVKISRMQFDPGGRALLITDSLGRLRFYEANRGRAARFSGHPVQTDTLPDGAVRTIWNGGRDTTFTVPGAHPTRIITNSYDVARGSVSATKATVQDSSAARPVVMDREMTRGWLGIALSCERCSLDGLDHTSSNKEKLFTTPPRVIAVDPIAGLVSGFKVGDVIRSIDGLAMTSPEGGARFSTLRAGERVKFVVERFDNSAGAAYQPTGVSRLMTLNLLVPKRP